MDGNFSIMFFMLGSSNPFALNPFGKSKPIPISKTPKELTGRKYHANVDTISITCGECNQRYCKRCASTETGVCDSCTKKGIGRLAAKIKAAARSKARSGAIDGADDIGSDLNIDSGGGKQIPKFADSWGSGKKS
jgi:hypothetical protein